MPGNPEFNPNEYKPVDKDGILRPVQERSDVLKEDEKPEIIEKFWICRKCQTMNKKGDLSCSNPECR